jgi:hypothetical protein
MIFHTIWSWLPQFSSEGCKHDYFNYVIINYCIRKLTTLAYFKFHDICRVHYTYIMLRLVVLIGSIIAIITFKDINALFACKQQ